MLKTEIRKNESADRPLTNRGGFSAPEKSRSDELASLAEKFRDPEKEARLMPFWFWNNHMSEEIIRRQVAEMAAAGVGGFFLHPRQGLDLPYLSDEWFERVKFAVHAARDEGLKVWLYDEYPYPSGIAGGKLTAEHPEFRARTLDSSTFDVEGGSGPIRRIFEMGRVVSALACPLRDGQVDWEEAIDVRRHFGILLTQEIFWRWELEGCPYNDKRFMADEGRQVLQWTPPPGQWRLFVGLEHDQRGFKYYDWYFDPLRKGASEAFLRLTHSRYFEAVGKEFGRTVVGIFTDETEPPAWSFELEEELREAFGLDLVQLLPALSQDDHPRAAEVRYRFKQCALRLFQERWEAPLAQWCHEKGIIWGAEKPTLRPSQFLSVGQPATDAGHRRVGDAPEPLLAQLRTNSRAAMAAAEQTGAGLVRCECFHNMGWGATLQDQKWQVDFLATQGVNRFTPHAFYASTSGLRKHDAAPSFFLETPVWQNYHLLADYVGRLSQVLGSGREVARIAVLHPTESLWVEGAQAAEVGCEYEWLMNHLMADHRIFHPVDSQMLKTARVEGTALLVGHARYEILLVPPLTAADKETAQVIRAALAAGIPVLMGTPLAEQNVDGTSLASLFALKGIIPIGSHLEWERQIEKAFPRSLSIALADGSEARAVWAAWREIDSRHFIFLANTSGEPLDLQLALPAPRWERWMLDDGQILSMPVSRGGKTHLTLPRYGTALLVSTADAVSPGPVHREAFILPTAGEWSLSLDRSNAFRLNRWKIGEDHEVEALPLRYYDKASDQWCLNLPAGQGADVAYRRTIHCRFVPDDLSLLIEVCAIPGDWSVAINGIVLDRKDFAPSDFLGSDKMICGVSQYFQPGENLITLQLGDVGRTGGIQTPIHLIGNFALTGPDRRIIDRLPARAEFGKFVEAGLPHFSGTVTLERSIEFPRLEKGTLIELPAGFEDVAEIILNGRSLGVRAWSPYTWTLPFAIEGEVAVQVRITNTLLPFFEGQYWDAAARVFRNV